MENLGLILLSQDFMVIKKETANTCSTKLNYCFSLFATRAQESGKLIAKSARQPVLPFCFRVRAVHVCYTETFRTSDGGGGGGDVPV